MTTFQNVQAPYITLVRQGSDLATPDVDTLRLFIDDADGHIKLIDESDVVREISNRVVLPYSLKPNASRTWR